MERYIILLSLLIGLQGTPSSKAMEAKALADMTDTKTRGRGKRLQPPCWKPQVLEPLSSRLTGEG